MSESLDETIQTAIDDLDEWLKDNHGLEPHDAIHEIADSSVPVYTYDLMELAMDNFDLVTQEPSMGPAFDGKQTAINIIAANVYEYISEELFDHYYADREGRFLCGKCHEWLPDKEISGPWDFSKGGDWKIDGEYICFDCAEEMGLTEEQDD